MACLTDVFYDEVDVMKDYPGRVCRGFVSDGVIPMSEAESAWLLSAANRRLRRLQWLVLGWLVAVVTLLFFGLAGYICAAVVFVMGAMLFGNDWIGYRRSVQSATSGLVEIFRTPLPQIADDIRFEADERFREGEYPIAAALRRVLPSGEVFYWTEEPRDYPTHADVQVPPSYPVPEPYDGRPLTVHEYRELWGKLAETQFRGVAFIAYGFLLLAVVGRDGFGETMETWYRSGVMNVGGYLFIVAGLVFSLNFRTIRAIRDRHTHLDGPNELLAGGRLWRYIGIPALDRWRVTQK